MTFSIPLPSCKSSWSFLLIPVLLLFAACKKNDPPVAIVTTVASGFTAPMGLALAHNNQFWVSEAGTIANDGSVWLVLPNGQKHLAIKNLAAFTNAHSGEPQGTAHILLDKGHLLILSGDYLYRVDVSSFKPGDKPIDAAKLPYEDIGAFAHNYPFKLTTSTDSHPYNMAIGPDGDLYIVDAGANAIIHRHGPGKYSVLAELPPIPNPTPVGGPMMESVPTSIWYDGKDFLVTTLTGFPFAEGGAVVYKVSRSGNVSTFQSGFTTGMDLVKGRAGNHVILSHGGFGPQGFLPNTGSISWMNGQKIFPITTGLNMPVALKQQNECTWYITCLGDGTVKKVTYQ